MDAMELLLGRRSAGKLAEPAPEGEALERILGAGLRAPDHGALRPWKVLLIRGEARERFGEIMADVLRARDAAASEEDLQRARRKALRAPLLAVVACARKESAKIPEIEQMLSAGCVAHAIVMAAQAEGFGAMWRTGDVAYDALTRERLGLDERDRLVGIVYLGMVATEPPEMPRPALDDIVREWNG